MYRCAYNFNFATEPSNGYYLATKVGKKSEKSALDEPDSKYVKRED
ncbi:hypothetical protein [Staphylococcus epidermidis]|nr:hypothetical protein [Staphylococcus epidermidis]MBF2233800.1 hypothetical protein [Staphylococcus epidermidis]MCG1730499.1 hypothetical protein [Staphylococcus epidermidis]HCD5949360.1 hypothetical protein [Staphylococcus aureus]